ncbi:gem-associated protein 7 isoform X2 [Callithrix jacchus]
MQQTTVCVCVSVSVDTSAPWLISSGGFSVNLITRLVPHSGNCEELAQCLSTELISSLEHRGHWEGGSVLGAGHLAAEKHRGHLEAHGEEIQGTESARGQEGIAPETPVTIPVPVLRLPRGPDGFSRGFAPDGRRAPLKPEVPQIQECPIAQESLESQEQRARAALRERYLRSLLAMVGRQVSFTLHEGVRVAAHFGATDLDVANFYVSQLQTPIGVQAEALLRCSDIISYTFKP